MRHGIASLLVLVLANAHGAVTTPEDRAEQLSLVEGYIGRAVEPVDQALMQKAGNPFSPHRGAVPEEKEKKSALSEGDLLKELAAQINPSGAIAIGGEYSLLFSERRATAGTELTVSYGSEDYTLTVKRVFSNGYVLSLGNSELQVKLK